LSQIDGQGVFEKTDALHSDCNSLLTETVNEILQTTAYQSEALSGVIRATALALPATSLNLARSLNTEDS
jgi:hypothetical protein